MILYGAGGHAKVVAEAIRASGKTINYIFDDAAISFSGIPVGPYDAQKLPEEALILSIGNNEQRKLVSEHVRHPFGIAIHPLCSLSEQAAFGVGSVAFQYTVIQPGVSIGKHCIINTAAIVEHDCSLENFIHIGPGSVLCGNVSIGEGSLVGANSTVLPNIKIGRWVVIGAGSVITTDIPDGAVIAGNPGKQLRS